MNAIEIEEAVSALAEAPFDAEAFPFAFLTAFGNKETAIKRLRAGATNQSDLPGGVLQRSNIHILVAPHGQIGEALGALRDSPRTKSAKARYILATDGATLEAEDLSSGETVACEYADLPNHFGFFLPLAGITTVRQIRESAFDIRATSRLNKLYVELLKDNPDWGTPARRSDMNHFMARLIFCFFAEDTDIFSGERRFTKTVDQMSARDSSNTHEVIETLFRAMNTQNHAAAGIPRWADFPYVNGGLFSGGTEVPRFSKMARTYLLHIGNLDWRQINPDIFGSMIQAVADDEERGALGMHYTSVPNILKVLNPLFLDELRAQLETAGNNPRMLLNLRKRMSRIRVFDPACGSGNFLVIAYKEMRLIEAEINRRRGEPDRRSEIPLTNFRGIELREFPAEIARLALIIAEYQADELHRGQKEAVRDFLPLNKENWITRGNALQLDWLNLCPPTGSGVKLTADDLFQTPLDQAQIDFENEGGETFLCGNPPYVGRKYQSDAQKLDLKQVFRGRSKDTLSLDYVSGWFIKAADYMSATEAQAAFVTTNSICQGIQVSALWPTVFDAGARISFAVPSFKWSNLASNNAGVTVSIVGLSRNQSSNARLFSAEDGSEILVREVENINAYLTPGENIFVVPRNRAPADRSPMQFGNHPYYANDLMLGADEVRSLASTAPAASRYLRPLYGSKEFISGTPRACLWLTDETVSQAREIDAIRTRLDAVASARRSKSSDAQAAKLVAHPHRFRDQNEAAESLLIVPIVSSENRPYLPVGLIDSSAVVHNKAFALYDSPLWNMALIASRLHWVWVGAVCVRLEMRFSYSNTLGWNTFPLPRLTDSNKAELTQCAEDILLAREAHYPATIADLYDPEKMPADLRAAHERNDETLERIYIGRRFRNDTERLEKLFEFYTKMTATVPAGRKVRLDQGLS